MMLSSPFEYTDYVRPACLPPPEFEFENGRMIVSGTGDTTGMRDFTDNVMYVTVPMCKNDRGCTAYGARFDSGISEIDREYFYFPF